jgi:hypothetical protein
MSPLLFTLTVLLITAVFAKDLYPRNIHLALFGDSSQFMRVTWTTTTNDLDYTPEIHYGMLPDNLIWLASGNKCKTTTYTNEEYHHTCDMYNTRHGYRYYYRIGSQPGETSIVAQFTMPPPFGSVQKSLLIGDLGVQNGSNTARLLELFASKINALPSPSSVPRISHINHCGDIAYSDDQNRGKPNPLFEPMNNQFAEMIQTAAASIPYMVAVGNHDISASLACPDDQLPEWGRNATHYNHRWVMPSDTSRGAASMWYQYTIGNTRFIVINTETDHTGAPFSHNSGDTRAGGFGDQEKWLETTLSIANRKESRLFFPWVIVIGHRPIYSTLINDFPANQQDKTRKWLEPLFIKHQVDMYVSGHSHLYERTYPLSSGVSTQSNYTNPTAPVYVVNGAAGNMEGHPVVGKDISTDLPEFIPFREALTYNVGLLETFSGLPPIETKKRFELTGDYVKFEHEFRNKNLFSPRQINFTPSPEEQDTFFMAYDAEIQKKAKTQNVSSAPTNTCPPKKHVISMCYTCYPVFATEDMFAKDNYMDRFCITKCV